MQDSLEALFARYRSTGRPEPLGALFDRCSSQLLGLALHLCPHPADAEDALQATFVVAIDRKATWDPARPLLPWLCGILTNQCRKVPQRRARRRECSLPAESVWSDEVPPSVASERRELVAEVREHVERLAIEQRQVLLLQLEHGLSPAEIAEVLGVAAGTVRMRLHRGLQALRAVLPLASLALLLSALPARGMTAVRAAVVAHAVGVGVIGVTGGLLVMKKTMWMAVLAALLLLGGGSFWWLWSASPSAAPPSGASVRAAVAPSDPGVAPAAENALQRIAVEAVAKPSSDRAVAGAGRLRVVTVEQATGAAVPFVPFRYYRLGDERELEHGCAMAATDAAGAVVLAGLRAGRWRVQLLLGSERSIDVPVDGECELRFPMHEAHLQVATVRIRVIDADGRPAAAATIVVAGRSLPGALPIGRTDAAGRFAARLATAATFVGATRPGSAPTPLVPCRPEQELELVLPGPAAAVHGIVRDAEGAPLAAVQIQVAAVSPWRPQAEAPGSDCLPMAPRQVVTDAAGRFEVADLPAAALHAVLWADGHARSARECETAAGGITEVDWQLERGLVLRGVVVDGDGQPVSAMVVLGDDASSVLAFTEVEGRFAFLHAPPLVRRLFVKAEGFAPRWVDRPADLAPGGLWRIELLRWPHYELRLVDAARQPLDGWSVRLAPVVQPRQWRTSDLGLVTVRADSFEAPQLFVGPPDVHWAFWPIAWPAQVQPGTLCDVVVSAADEPRGGVSGAVTAFVDGTFATAVELLSVDGSVMSRAVVQDAQFRFTRVPPGDWWVRMCCPGWEDFGERLAVTALAAGENRTVGALPMPAQGRLEVRLGWPDGGGVPRDARLQVCSLPDWRWGSWSEGVHPVPAGRYRWQVNAEHASAGGGEIEVVAGQSISLAPELVPGIRRLLLLLPAASTFGRGALQWRLRAADGREQLRGEVDSADDVALAIFVNAPAGRWSLVLQDAIGRSWTGALRIDRLVTSRLPIEVVMR